MRGKFVRLLFSHRLPVENRGSQCQGGAIVGQMGLSRANNTATGLVADVIRRLRDRALGSKCCHRSKALRRHPIWPKSAEFGMARSALIRPFAYRQNGFLIVAVSHHSFRDCARPQTNAVNPASGDGYSKTNRE